MKSLLIAAALALPVAPAFAQPAPPPPGGPDHGPDAGEMARHKADMARDLAIVLALEPAQQPALEQWLAAMAPPPPPPPGGPEGMRPGAEATTPEKLQRREAHLAERQRHEQAEIEATKRFYATLDPRQKQVFDALGRLRHEHRGGPGPHHGPEGRGPGGPGDHGPGAPRPAG